MGLQGVEAGQHFQLGKFVVALDYLRDIFPLGSNVAEAKSCKHAST